MPAQKQILKIEGLAQLGNRLEKLPTKIESRISREALTNAAELVETAIKARAPVYQGDAGYPTSKYGRLIDNIKVTRSRKIRDGFHIKVHTGDAFWALFLELGTVRMAAQPFVLPAWESTKFSAWDELRDGLEKGIEREA